MAFAARVGGDDSLKETLEIAASTLLNRANQQTFGSTDNGHHRLALPAASPLSATLDAFRRATICPCPAFSAPNYCCASYAANLRIAHLQHLRLEGAAAARPPAGSSAGSSSVVKRVVGHSGRTAWGENQGRTGPVARMS